jgi:hypothetical protein
MFKLNVKVNYEAVRLVVTLWTRIQEAVGSNFTRDISNHK